MAFHEISVVVPAYKEAEIIEGNILALDRYLKPRFERYEIIVVTDGSPDATRANVERLGAAQPDLPLILIPFPVNQGKGAAVRTGILHAHFDPVLFLDADLTIPIEELEKFLSALETADMVIASRLVAGARYEEPQPWYRFLMARGFHILQMLLLGNFEFSDTQCGFKLFRRDIARRLFEKVTIRRFAFDAETLFLASKFNLRVDILPVTIKKDPRNTNVDPLRDSVNMLFALVKIRWNNLVGRYR